MISNINREDIAQELREYCQKFNSQNRAAAAIGIAPATVSAILNNDWALVSDAMFTKVADAIGYEASSWQAIETKVWKNFNKILSDAQENAFVMAVTSDAGSGKTFTSKNYVKSHAEAYHISCKSYWTKKDFLIEIGRAIGNRTDGKRVTILVDEIINTLRWRDSKPLLILDEADKLSDTVLQLFITLYNDLEGKCGIVLCATDHLEMHIRRGVNLGHTGFNEIISRLGRKFIALPSITSRDVTMICEANGITSADDINEVLIGSAYEGKAKGKNALYDLRRVHRIIDAKKLN
ncbi:MAG: ATP-binding protein [Paludibacteraceae bacterium]|nr:ATP-binding protein [Paludibacteraceae bacterium]